MVWFDSFGWTISNQATTTVASLRHAYNKYFLKSEPLPRVWSKETIENVLVSNDVPYRADSLYDSLQDLLRNSEVSFMLMGLVDENTIGLLSYPDLRELYRSWTKNQPNVNRRQMETEILQREKEIVYPLALYSQDFRQLRLDWTPGELQDFQRSDSSPVSQRNRNTRNEELPTFTFRSQPTPTNAIPEGFGQMETEPAPLFVFGNPGHDLEDLNRRYSNFFEQIDSKRKTTAPFFGAPSTLITPDFGNPGGSSARSSEAPTFGSIKPLKTVSTRRYQAPPDSPEEIRPLQSPSNQRFYNDVTIQQPSLRSPTRSPVRANFGLPDINLQPSHQDNPIIKERLLSLTTASAVKREIPEDVEDFIDFAPIRKYYYMCSNPTPHYFNVKSYKLYCRNDKRTMHGSCDKCVVCGFNMIPRMFEK